MSRSAADATRFTATGPYVNSKAPYQLPGSLKSSNQSHQSPNSPQSPSASTSPSTETPRQKVERLRAQARAAKLSQSTTRFDRIIERGRRVANGAHKVMIYTLIAASGVCGAVTLYSVVSLTNWTRRQRELWLDKQLKDLQSAREAYVQGTATPEQLEILRNEKIGEIEKRQRKEAEEQRLWNRAKRFLFEGLKNDEADTTASNISSNNYNNFNNDGDKTFAEGVASFGIMEAVNAKKAETAQQQQPGALDVLASNAETTAKQSAKSWSNWILRR